MNDQIEFNHLKGQNWMSLSHVLQSFQGPFSSLLLHYLSTLQETVRNKVCVYVCLVYMKH